MALSVVPAGVLANVKRTCAEVVAAAAAAGVPVSHVWGYGLGPDHNNRRCVDYMAPSRRVGDFVAEYLWQHRERLGLELMIWRRRIRRTYRKGLIPAGRWAPYLGTSGHWDHLHAQQRAQGYRGPSRVFLGPYRVDPAKVSSFLYQVRADGSTGARRPPGYLIRTGVRIARIAGRRWLITESGNRYALDYLRRV